MKTAVIDDEIKDAAEEGPDESDVFLFKEKEQKQDEDKDGIQDDVGKVKTPGWGNLRRSDDISE